VEIRLLGPLEVQDEDRPVRVPGARQRALLAILLTRANEVVSADRLIDDLWGETPPAEPANALQAAVSRLRRALGPMARDGTAGLRIVTRPPGYRLEVDTETIDAARFERLSAEGCKALTTGDAGKALALLDQALALWRGPALAEFSYDTFALAEIERLEELRLTALEARAQASLANGLHAELPGELRALVSSHPLSERLRGQLMVALCRAGRQGEALQVYHEGVRVLAEELGIEPGPDLRQVAAAILEGDPDHVLAPPLGQPGGWATNIASQATSFIGRDHEMGELMRLLADRRLVTLTGPGGSGKTRLALHVAAKLVHAFPDGVWHVDLTAVPSTRYIVHAIATVLRFPIDQYTSDLDAKSQLLDYLHGRSMLLVLDNAEHLTAGSDLYTEIVDSAPAVKILLTSRARLNLRNESVLDLAGLPYLPARNGQGDPDALCLFIDRARQVDPHLDLSVENRTAALRICSLVEGMPLGLELASAWAAALPCSEIAREIERSFDFLSTTMHDIPEGHRSMRAAFQHSWNLLSGPEQAGLRKLSVFKGSFDRDAALEVADVDLRLLTDLVGKSVVRREGAGRFGMHSLIRQYAAERLTARSEECMTAVRRHAEHYVRRLTERERSLIGDLALQAREEMRPDVADLRDAILDAVTRWDGDRALAALRSLFTFYRLGLHEGIAAFHELVEALEGRGVTIASEEPARVSLLAAIVSQAFCETICGVTSSEATLRRCLPILRADPRLGRELGLALLCVGTDVDYRGDAREAVTWLDEALAVLHDVGDESLVWPCLLWLGWARLELGQGRRATAIFHEAHEISARIRDLQGVAYSLTKLGAAADARGAYAEGKRYHMGALDAFIRLGDRAGPAYAISRMSLSAWGMGRFVEAERLGREGLELSTAIGHSWGIGTSYSRIGFAQLGQGRVLDAGASFRCALQYALDHELASVGLYALVGAGAIMVRTGNRGRGAWLLRFVRRHPDVPAFYRSIAQRELAAVRAGPPADSGDGQLRHPFGHGLVEVAQEVLDELPTAERRRPQFASLGSK
jgi:predicted ATPase/DNA-binding SARP family transcriptional activator